MLFWIAPAFKLAPYVLGGLDYLRNLLFPPAASTSPATAPFTPPFSGGQCAALYHVNITFKGFNYGVPIHWIDQNQFNNIQGKISRLENIVESGFIVRVILKRINSSGIEVNAAEMTPTQGQQWTEVTISRVIRVDGQPDNCGDAGNPNPSQPVSDDGIAASAPPNLDSAPIVIEAVPPIILPSFAAALAAALAAARNALDALDAIKAVARAIEALSDLLNKKNDEENEKEKEKKDKQDTIRYQFGSIEKDGFLRLYPQSNLVKYVAQQLDISFITIPSYLGKYFGKFSPNYYRYKPTSNLISSLGYISFVSPTFGVLSTHHLEFRRTSIKVPENSIGFYYHLGLDGALTANAFAFYTKPKP